MDLNELFHQKTTENGDLSFDRASSNNLVNLLFMSEYYNKHIGEVSLGTSDKEKLFAMFMRDPRFGLGRRDLGRRLMQLSQLSPEEIVKAGRFDDLMYAFDNDAAMAFWKSQIEAGNELAKKWAPRYSSKNLMQARTLAKLWGFNKQEYGHFIKVNTTENKLSRKHTEEIVFEHVPSLAMLKYARRFSKGEDTKMRFAQYMQDVKSGKKELHVSTTTVYDIYKNREVIDPNIFFEKMEKIAINCIPVVDTSGSMLSDDAMGKALSIGHYLAKCSTYCPNQVITFSSHPTLIELGKARSAVQRERDRWSGYVPAFTPTGNQYLDEIKSMDTGDCSNTNFGAVMDLLQGLDKFPEYIVVLTDMEFDTGSHQSTERLEQIMREHGANTKIVWWNLNSRNTTAPEMDKNGNIFMSGYSPMLLKYLQVGFNAEQFLDKLLQEYANNVK